MKKVYSLLGLLLFFFSNAAYAQLGWEYEEKNVEEIIAVSILFRTARWKARVPVKSSLYMC